MKIKILLWSIASILIIGIIAAAVWWELRPQVITMSDGSKLTLLAVQYGKKHAPPNVKMPAGTRARRGNSINTTNDTLVVWVRQEYDSKEYHYFQYYAYDMAGVACVGSSWVNNGNGGRQGNEVIGVRFEGFPRRQGKFFLRVQEQGNGGQELSDQKFIIRNPARGPFQSWTPDLLPNTQDDDDLSVTLTKLASAAAMPYQRDNDDADDAMNKGVQATFNVERNGKPVTDWEPVSVETSDATGNHVNGWINSNNSQNGQSNSDGTFIYQYGLWPDEPAWKVRFEFSQQSDFSADELWNIHNLPVLPGKQQEMYNYGGNRRQATTNSPFAETDLNGFHLKIFSAKDFTDAGNNNWMQGGLFIQVNPDVSNGYRMTVNVTDDQTNNIQSSEYGIQRNNNNTFYRYRLQDIAGLTNLNVCIALHKSRFVEFTAKPEKSPPTPAAGAQ
jgi:hypothetical protein